MAHTQWEKQTGLCLRKQMQQASAKSYSACFKDKKQKTSFLTEREVTPKIPRKLFVFWASFCTSPFLFPHTLNQQTQMFTRIHPWYPPHHKPCKCKGRCLSTDAQCQLCCKVMYKQRALFISAGEKLHGLNPLQRPKDLEIQCLQKCDFWLLALGVHILGPCLFSNTMFLLLLAQHWTEEWDVEDRKEPYTNKNCNTLLLSYLWNS